MQSNIVTVIKRLLIQTILAISQRSVCKVKKIESIELIRVGSEYGGYWIPRKFLESSISKSAISLGLGFDVTLDIELLNNGFAVLGVEPSKSSIDFVAESLDSYIKMERFSLFRSAVGGTSGKVIYTKPNLNKSYQWWANENNGKDLNKVTLDTVTLRELEDLYPRFFHQELVILKMDIEGAELGVLKNLVQGENSFDYLAIELDYISLIPARKILTRIKKVLEVRNLLTLLENQGFTLLKREEFNYFWISNKHVSVAGNV